MISLWKLFRKALNVKKMYVVEYQTSTMLEPQRFVYEYMEEDYQNKRMEYINETSGQVLTLYNDKTESTLTSPFPIYEN